ncbi:MAG TPA: glutathione synthase, partial [Oceanospirillaceae bacterium]|nr:glutathione synthase [Oceanospirillaceae bacterium]
MTIRLGIIMDPIHNINFKKDSSLAMLWAAQDRGWQIFYMEPQHLYAEQGVAMGLMAPLSVMRDAHHFYELDEQHAS